MPRKHLVATQTNKKQQMQAKIWQKLAKEIKAAVKVGGPKIDANPRLKAAVDKALQNNLSKESIERNINGNQKDNVVMNQLQFECYGPEGIQIIIGALTDNVNRTISSLNGYLSKLHGTIAKTNSVRIFFENLGDIIVIKNSNINVDKLMELTLDYKIVDIIELDDCYEIKTIPTDFYNVKDLLIKNNIQIFEAEIKLIANETIKKISDDSKQRLERFVDSCENDDDMQWIVTNYDEE